jgi:hypothetical protein
MSYKPVDPQSISDAYREVNQTFAEAEDWKRQTCEVLGKSEAFRAVLLAVQIWSEQQIASGVSTEASGLALLEGIMASGFQLGLLAGERTTAARCTEIAQSSCNGLCGSVELAFIGGSDLAKLLHGLGLSIRDVIEGEFKL